MAITATFTEERRDRIGKQTAVTGYFTLTGSATAGGFAVSASTFGLNSLEDVMVFGGQAGTGATTAEYPLWDKTAGTIALYEGGATANDNAFDESDLASTTGYIVRVKAFGR